MYDNNGFFVLIPRKKDRRKRANIIGEYSLKMVSNDITEALFSNSISRSMGTISLRLSSFERITGDQIKPNIPTKSWKYKAWESANRAIYDWYKESDFKGVVKSKKLQHAKAVVVYMKIYSSGNGKNLTHYRLQVNADELHNQRSASVKSNYVAVTCAEDFMLLMSKIHNAIQSDNLYRYLSDSADGGFDTFNVVTRTMVFYDDMSYDVITLDPLKLFKFFEISFDKKGNIK